MRKIMGTTKRIYRTLFPSLIEHLRNELMDCKTVLDLGCGRNSPIQYISIPYTMGVEVFDPYLAESRAKGIHNEYVKYDVRKIEFKENSFDAVLALDLLEHLTKKEGINLIKKMEKIAKKKVIIFTPNGFLFQEEYDENIWQTHKSGWAVKELKDLNFKVYGINGWKKLRGYRAEPKFRPKLLWEIISNLTQKVTYRCPKYAFQLLCIKSV